MNGIMVKIEETFPPLDGSSYIGVYSLGINSVSTVEAQCNG